MVKQLYIILAIIFFGCIGIASAELTDGLIAYWNMDNYGNITDLSGNNNNLLLYSEQVNKSYGIYNLSAGPFSLDKFYYTNAIQFSGSINKSISLNIKFNSLNSNQWMVVSDGGQTYTQYWLLHYIDDKLKFSVWTYGYVPTYIEYDINASEWYNIVMTYNADDYTSILYVNGEYIGSTVEYQTLDSHNFLALGVGTNINFDWQDYFFDGYIDEVAVWGRVLSVDEIEELYNNGNILTYNGTEFAYREYVPCEELWVLDNNPCINGERLISYTDLNSCGTYINIPANNNTYEECNINTGYTIKNVNLTPITNITIILLIVGLLISLMGLIYTNNEVAKKYLIIVGAAIIILLLTVIIAAFM